jgi:hypothetical protein
MGFALYSKTHAAADYCFALIPLSFCLLMLAGGKIFVRGTAMESLFGPRSKGTKSLQ